MTDYIDDPQYENVGSCRWCGAAITHDPAFQELHMEVNDPTLKGWGLLALPSPLPKLNHGLKV